MYVTILVLAIVLSGSASGELSEVVVKSHAILSKGFNHDKVASLYDNDLGTPAGFYSTNPTTAEVQFDLGKNHAIDHVLFHMKREKTVHNISLLVGNLINGQGGLFYICDRPDQSTEVYKCEPECRSSDKFRPGIIARTFIMRLFVSSSWISVYDMKVFASSVQVSDDISNNRLVLPSNCRSRSWLLTDKSIPANISSASVTKIDVYFEKPYVVTEIDVELDKIITTTLEVTMMSGQGKSISLAITLADCMLQKGMYSCKVNAKTFAARQVQFSTLGLLKVSIRGKSVFYPKLEIKTSTNVKEKLRMSCEYSACDLSIHSDCSEDTIKSGVRFDCVNKRLIRMPIGSDPDSYVIVNHGDVEAAWKSTKFSVISNNDDIMSISMPRSYQYFGQYKCSCIVADKMNTEISSDITQLKEVDFLEDLFFDTSVQYKLSDSDDAPLYNVSNNVIYLSKSNVESTFIPVKISMYSLVPGNTINVRFFTSESDVENSNTDRSTLFHTKAFKDIIQSWAVTTQKYVVDEIFPEFNHLSNISISGFNSLYKFRQNDVIRILDSDRVKLKPATWISSDNKTTQVNVMYAGTDDQIDVMYTEKSCASTNKIRLASLTKDKCTSMDPRLRCSSFNNATLLTYKEETNFAKILTLNLINSKTQATVEQVKIKNEVVLNQDDVLIKPRYTSLAPSAKDRQVNVVRVDLDVISKKIYDFIPCGSVMVSIRVPKKDKKEMVLQKSTFFLDVDMDAFKEMNVNITVIIDGAKGSHESQILVTDPTTFSAKNVELQEDKTLNLLWHGIDDIARDLLESYELNITTTVLACISSKSVIKSVPKSQTTGGKNRYQVSLDPSSMKHMTSMVVTIQPVFVGNTRGQVRSTRKQFNNIAQSSVSMNQVQLTKERTLTVIPSQSDLPCDSHKVLFNITGINVEKFQWTSVSLDNMKYKITGLVPGRKYKLTAKVIYKYGPEDLISKPYIFETADDISILQTKHVAQLNEQVNISCTADIGPQDKFIKTVQWLRADKSGLPDGVRSEISGSNPRVAFLIMEKALADYSGEYGCFARPSAAIGSMTISIIINDLVISPTKQLVDFSNKEKVSVTCSSSAVGDTKVVWVDPLGATIQEGDSDPRYSIERVVTEQNVDKATLTIKAANLALSGTYKCHKSVGDIKANKEFFLYGSEKIRIETLAKNSTVVGGKRQFRCVAEAGSRTQKVEWEIPSLDKGEEQHSSVLFKTSYPNPLDQTTQDLEIVNSVSIHQLRCKLVPALDETKEPISASLTLSLQSKIVVNGPEEVNMGATANLTCLGYPDSRNMKLKWMFYSKNATTKGEVVKISEASSSSASKSYEPIRLSLNLTDVKEKEAGRYECKFVSESRSGGGPLPGKSISLVVNALAQPPKEVVKEQSNPGGDALSSVMQCPVMVVLVSLLTVLWLTGASPLW